MQRMKHATRKADAVKALSITVKTLSALYAVLMMVAALAAVGTQPLWSLVLTFAFALCLLASLRWDWLLPLGLLGLIAAAIANGYSMYGQVTVSHLALRVLVSLLVFALWLIRHLKTTQLNHSSD